MKNKYFKLLIVFIVSMLLGVVNIYANCYKTASGSYSKTSSSGATKVDDYYCRVNECAIKVKSEKGGCGRCGRSYAWDEDNNRCDLSSYSKNYSDVNSCVNSAKSDSDCTKCNKLAQETICKGSATDCGYKWSNNQCVPLLKDADSQKNTSSTSNNQSTVTSSSKTSCGNVTGIPKKIPELTSYIITMIEIIVPIILVITGAIDLFKGLTAQKEEEIKKGYQMLIKRLILAAIVFLLIAIVKFITSIVADSTSSGNAIACMDCFLRNSCGK